MKVISWFSAGISSALATKIALETYPDLEIIYQHINEQHADTMRFIKDCEKWFNKEIKIIQHPYSSVENVIRLKQFINSPQGPACSRILKVALRRDYERLNHVDLYVWGFDASKREIERAERRKEKMPEFKHYFPLIDKGYTKEVVHYEFAKSGIKRPVMYELGYPNNNCIGCVRGGMGYWNKISVDFPEVFDKMAKLEREIGASCINGTYLDELDHERGRKLKPIVPDCGSFCEPNLFKNTEGEKESEG